MKIISRVKRDRLRPLLLKAMAAANNHREAQMLGLLWILTMNGKPPK